jgi:hypothetical protein
MSKDDDGIIIRVRSKGVDKYDGLKGADYINARGLSPETAMQGLRKDRRASDRADQFVHLINNWKSMKCRYY